MDNCLFSIVVPVYNVEKYLSSCMESLLKQSLRENRAEIILIDDGSQDQSGKICDRYAEMYSQIRVFHKENGGLSSARNLGIKKANGRYILFVDSDDYIESDTCRRLSDVLQSNECPDVISFGGVENHDTYIVSMRRIDLDESVKSDGKSFLLRHYRSRNMNVEACLYAYKKEFLDKNHLYFKEGILHEDVEFTPRVLLCAEVVLELPDKLYHYVIRENSISTQKNKEKNIKDLFCTLEEQDELAEQQEEELRKWMKDAILCSYLNMIQEAQMYHKKYRKYVNKRFLLRKAATNWNRIRVLICLVSVHLYCWINNNYKKIKAED